MKDILETLLCMFFSYCLCVWTYSGDYEFKLLPGWLVALGMGALTMMAIQVIYEQYKNKNQ